MLQNAGSRQPRRLQNSSHRRFRRRTAAVYAATATAKKRTAVGGVLTVGQYRAL
jgi:hypothetical protein